MTTLYLTLKKKPFDIMISGEKKFEYRNNSKWIESRLINSKNNEPKKYKYIKFTNGYGHNRPYFICEYKGFKKIYNIKKKYSNNFIINYPYSKLGYYCIILGEIISSNK